MFMYVSLLDSGGDEQKHSRVAFIDVFGLAAVSPLCRSLRRSVFRRPYLRSLLGLSLAGLLGEIGAHLTCSLIHSRG